MYQCKMYIILSTIHGLGGDETRVLINRLSTKGSKVIYTILICLWQLILFKLQKNISSEFCNKIPLRCNFNPKTQVGKKVV